MLTVFRHLTTHPLLYDGDCKLIGVTNDQVYVEELYGDDDWLAQHHLSLSDGIIHTEDELSGQNLEMTPMTLPADLVRPDTRACCEHLNFKGARLRGRVQDEPIHDLVLPLSLADREDIIDFMEWDIIPSQMIGIAESVVLSHTQLPNALDLVCRRIRIVYHLAYADGQSNLTYDYDALTMYVLHEVDANTPDPPELVDCLNDIDEVVLLRPMDCLYHQGKLFVADGGEDDDVSAIHVFEYQEKLNST